MGFFLSMSLLRTAFVLESLLLVTKPARAQMDDDEDTIGSGSTSYYLILLVILVLGLIGCFILLVTKRRRSMAAAARARLVTDMEATQGQRSLIAQRHGGSHSQSVWGAWGIPMITRGPTRAPQAQREEGLNERGEAPPPYMAKQEDDASTAVGSINDAGESHRAPKYEDALLESDPGEVNIAQPPVVHQSSSRRSSWTQPRITMQL